MNKDFLWFLENINVVVLLIKIYLLEYKYYIFLDKDKFVL